MPPEREVKEEVLSKAAQSVLAEHDPLSDLSLKQLTRLEDDVEEDVLEKYRRQRLEEIRKQREKDRFGAVLDIGMEDYVREVTEASREATVLCLLYKSVHQASDRAVAYFATLAQKHKSVKFCQGVSSRLVANFDDKLVPTILVYRDGVCNNQISGISMYGGEDFTVESMEWVLARKFKVFKTALKKPPHPLDAGGFRGRTLADGRRGLKGTALAVHADDDSEDGWNSDRDEDEDSSERSDEEGRRQRGGDLNTAASSRAYGDTTLQARLEPFQKD